MNDKEIPTKCDEAREAKPLQGGEPVVQSRRRLFRQGASVVAVTLASRPVLAWHCKTTSAWGSELINPTTSLKTDQAHPLYPDEGWYIADWARNTNTNSALGVVGFPWATLLQKYPTLKDASTTTNGNFDFNKVTISKLVGVVGLVKPSGVNSASLAKNVFLTGSNFKTAVLAAQLNYILLSPLDSPFQQEKCISLSQIKTMAAGSYSPMPGVTWGQQEIYDYLTKNWIVR